MKYLFICLLSFSILSTNTAQEIGYEISPTYKKSIKKEILNDAKTLKDINPEFPSSWIETYHSIEVSTTNDGNTISIASKTVKLNKQQLSAINKANVGTDIHVSVHYTPKNSTPGNKREIKFTYTIVPEIEAKFSDDYQKLKDYLKTNVIDKLSKDVKATLENMSVNFTIGVDGKPINAMVKTTSKDKKVDQLIIDMITNMPSWQPAELTNGSKIEQDFVLTVGSMIGC